MPSTVLGSLKKDCDILGYIKNLFNNFAKDSQLYDTESHRQPKK